MRITKNTLLTAFVLGSITGAISIAVPIPEHIKAQGLEPKPFYQDQDAATWWERNDDKTALEKTRTSKRKTNPDDPKHDDQGGWVVDHILELQVVVDAFSDDNRKLNDKSKAISDEAWKKAHEAVNGDDKDGCKKVAKEITVLTNLLGITEKINLGKMAAVIKVLNKNTGGNDYAKKWKDWIKAIIDELDNHQDGVGDVITNIGKALKDITGEDAVAIYIDDFSTNHMQAVQTFLKEQDADNSGSSSTTPDPNAKPRPPVGTAPPAQANPTCSYDSVNQYAIQDVKAAQDKLTHSGYGNNNDNCCTAQDGSCGQLMLSGGVAVLMCGTGNPNMQCAACANIAIALNVLNIDCAKNYMIGGTEPIPYLDGVRLELAPSKVT